MAATKGVPVARFDEKIKEGARPLLEQGEEVIAAFIAAPRGFTQSTVGLESVGDRQQGRVESAAEQTGLRLEAPMAVALTARRLLTIKISSPIGLGMGGKVKEILSSVPLADIDSIEVSRLAMGTTIAITIRGVPIKLEAGAGAKTKELAEEFRRLKAAGSA